MLLITSSSLIIVSRNIRTMISFTLTKYLKHTLLMALVLEIVFATNTKSVISSDDTTNANKKNNDSLLPFTDSFSFSATCDGSTQIPFQFEIMTDQYPIETSWMLIDVQINEVVYFVQEGTYDSSHTFYQANLCLESSSCYQFEIFDKQSNGICCSWGNGWFHIFYNDKILMEGSNFGESDTSVLFGSGCSSSSLFSMSSSESTIASVLPTSTTPSLSLTPTSSQKSSLIPSNSPTISITTTPVLSPKPSSQLFLPPVSGIPSSAPLALSNEPSILPSSLVESPNSSLSPTTLSSLSPSATPTTSTTSKCKDSQAPFRIELMTDRWPTDTSWVLIDINTSNIIESVKKQSYKMKDSLHSETYCVDDTAKCYQFTISDAFNDGICCTVGSGWYKVFYKDQLVMKGGDFGKNEVSPLFGGLCPTYSPSESFSPTFSMEPSPLPSQMASFVPSAIPSAIPSLLPTTSIAPTVSPTERPVDLLIALDENNRRYFPQMPIRPPESLSYQPAAPDCTSSSYGSVGCVRIPRSFEIYPYWAGTIYPTPPSCNKRKKQCKQGVPIPRTTHPLGKKLLSINSFEGDIEPLINLPGGTLTTNCISLVDVNNDGMMDIIFGNHGANNQILINTGEGGGFQHATDLPGGAYDTFSIAVADLNNDGMVDIVIGNWNHHNQLLINTGDGTFDNVINLPGGDALRTRSMAIADLDNDGKLDIVIGNEVFQKNLLLMNAGDDTFIETTLPGGLRDTYSIAAADIDNDGTIDIIVGNRGERDHLLLGDGNGWFKSLVFFVNDDDFLGDNEMLVTSSLALADVNNDGMLDIIIGTLYHTNLLVINAGNGSFQDPIDLPGGGLDTDSITVADINNDGMIDIVVGNRNEKNKLLINAGDGSFDNVINLPGGNNFPTYYIATADLDNDGMTDIVIGNQGKENQLMKNHAGRGEIFNKVLQLPGGNWPTHSLSIADINNDGILDLVVGNRGSNNQLLINIGRDDSFQHVIDLPGGTMHTYSIVAADIDNDGMLDIVVGNGRPEPRGQNNQLLINTGDGTFNHVIDLPGGALETHCVAVADINNDGMLDIVVGNKGHKNQLLMNVGNGTFNNVIDLPGTEDSNTTSIAIADLNNDGMVDIVIGNGGTDSWQVKQENQLLINNGDGNFENIIYLPGGASRTLSIAIADIDNDGVLDIIIGNWNGSNQLLINDGDGSFDDIAVIDLPGGELFTNSIVVADINNDGMVDVVVGNGGVKFGQNNQLLINAGNGSFVEDIIDLPGGALRTYSIAVADIDNDGLLDIVVGNRGGGGNQLLPYSVCPNGGARLHSKSWCFQCPSFMGKETSICRECITDFVQRIVSGGGEQSCATEIEDACPLRYQRKLGEDLCSRCPDGTYFVNNDALMRSIDDPSTWYGPTCIECEPGEYATQKITTIDQCLACKPGTYQPDKGATYCLNCTAGSFQPEFGSATCDSCPKGGYCNVVDAFNGGFIPCPPGSFNDKNGQSNETVCQLCPAGTYSTTSGGTSAEVCLECQPGTYSNQPGQAKCISCAPGTFQRRPYQTSCEYCPNGTYADKYGFEECIKCPYRLGSKSGSVTCSFCDIGFYLNDRLVIDSTDDIFLDPFKYCLPCPPNALCGLNTSLFDLGIEEDYWRRSRNTSRLYSCETSNACVGTNIMERRESLIMRTRNDDLLDDTITGVYCEDNYTGPLCEVCVQPDYYFDDDDGKCNACPPLSELALRLVGIFTVAAIIGFIVSIAMDVFPWFFDMLSSISLEAKLKILVSFYQIITSLEDVYGVQLELSSWWLNLFKYLSLDFLEIISFPIGCIGSTKQQLILGAVWPYINIIVGGVFVYLGHIIVRVWKNSHDDEGEVVVLSPPLSHSEIVHQMKKWTIEWTLILFYFALPTISQHIFSAIKCRAFQTNDNPLDFVSYLLVDMSIECDSKKKDSAYSSILMIFWVFFANWIVLIPLGFLVLLYYISESIHSKSISFLADSCRFLWQDYEPSMWYWDVVDTWRKIFLTGAIMLIDPEEGSNKMFRLVIANIVSTLYLSIFLIFCPYRQSQNYYLGLVSNFLLISSFSLGIILKLCDSEDYDEGDSVGGEIDGDDNGTCHKFIGFSLNSRKASIVVLVLAMGMLLSTIGLVIILAVNKVVAPVVQMVSSGSFPNLELPESCNYHIFMSRYVQKKDQVKTDVIVREKMEHFLPGLKVCENDKLQDTTTEIEKLVERSAVFVVFYRKNYFRSRICRREIYAAMKFKKPMILIYEGDQSVIEQMKQECIRNCDSDSDAGDLELFQSASTSILQTLIGEDEYDQSSNTSTCVSSDDTTSSINSGPIQWLNEGAFSAAALNRIYHRVLSNLPFYVSHPSKLEGGIEVPGELGNVSFQSPINLLLHDENNRECMDVVASLKEIQFLRNSHLMTVLDTTTYLQTRDQDEEVIHEDDDKHNGSHDDSSRDDSHDDVLLQDNYDKEDLENNLSISNNSEKPATATIFLLYLNEYTFEGNEQNQCGLTTTIQSCIDDPNISIVLVHEQDPSKGGCKFDVFFEMAPEELINPPYELFNKCIAIPLYSRKEYRDVSLRKILCTMGATPVVPSRSTRLMRSFRD